MAKEDYGDRFLELIWNKKSIPKKSILLALLIWSLFLILISLFAFLSRG